MCRNASTVRSRRNARSGNGFEFLLSELRQHFAQQLTDALGLFGHHLVQGDGIERDARPELVHPALVPEVGLAEFQETPARAQHGKAGGDRLSGQGVEHHVDSLAAGLLP